MKMTLENKIEVIRGVNYKPSIDLRTSSDADSIALLRANNIKNGCIAFDDVQYVSKSKVKIEQLLRKGDILVCASSGSKQLVGKAALITRDIRATFGAFCCVIRPISISPCFLSNYFSSSAYRVAIEEACSGSNINNLKPKNFYDLQIPNYSLDEQAEISEKLSKARSLIERCQSLNIYLDELVKSRFVEMFGNADSSSANFNISTINEICSSIVRGPFGSALKKEFFIPGGVGTYKVYEQKHAIRKRADIGTYYISKEKFDSLKRFECKPGDILMSCSGTMGELYQLPMNCEPGIINQALCKFTLNEKILPEYFFRFMSQVVDDLGAKGSGIKNVSSVKYIKDIKIPLPPLSLQQEFAAFVHQVDKLKFDLGSCLFVLKEEFFRLIG